MVGKGFSIKLHPENNSTLMRETNFREIIVIADDIDCMCKLDGLV